MVCYGISVVVNCNGYTDLEESENKKRREKEEELASLSLFVFPLVL